MPKERNTTTHLVYVELDDESNDVAEHATAVSMDDQRLRKVGERETGRRKSALKAARNQRGALN